MEAAKDILVEAMRILSASERVRAFMWVVDSAYKANAGIADVAPDLEPETTEINARLDEISNHLEATMNVLTTKLQLLRGEE